MVTLHCLSGFPRPYEDDIDFVAEIAIVMGNRARDVSEAEIIGFALDCTIGNDMSDRAVQFKDSRRAHGKSHDTVCP